MSNFRLNAKQLFLTYPKCPLTKEEVLAQLMSKLPIDGYIICRELHQDGQPHVHCLIKLERKVNLRNAQALDLQGEGENYHGNYQAARSMKAVAQYVQKGMDYMATLDVTSLQKENEKVFTTARELAKTSKLSEALELLESTEKSARDLTIHQTAISNALKSLAPLLRVKTPDLTMEDFNQWNVEWDQNRTLILYGPTATGKTSLAALLLERALFATHPDMLKEYNPQLYHGIILDDMSFKHLPRTAQIHLVDREQPRGLHARYTTAWIPAGTPMIITSNECPDQILDWHDGAIRRRCQAVWVPEINVFEESQ